MFEWPLLPPWPPSALSFANPIKLNVDVNRAKHGAARVLRETCLTQESVPTIVLHNQRGLVRVRGSPKLEWTRAEARC
jgi:hypothetical protein